MSNSPEELLKAWRRGWCAAQSYALPCRRGTSSSGSGGQRRRLSGQSLDFNDHRPYVQGDDVRHLNWRVYATTGQLVLKTFEQEVNPWADIVLDGSRSMAYTPAKQVRWVELAGWLVASCERQGLKTQLYGLGVGLKSFAVFSEHLVPELFEGEPCGGLNLQIIPWRTHSLRILVSDLLFPGELKDLLFPMAQGAGAGWVYCPFDPCEAEPDWSEHLRFEDVESGQQKLVSLDKPWLERYRWAYRAHVDEMAKACARVGLAQHRVTAEGPWSKVLPSLGESGAQWLG